MFISLQREARLRASIWRRQLELYWRFDAREHLPFLAMAGAAAVVVAGVIGFACFHTSQQETPAAVAQTMSRELKRAQRRESDLQCLAENVYFESRGEPLKGQYAVAEVTLNRTRAEHFP